MAQADLALRREAVPASKWIETYNKIGPRASLTVRAAAEICRRVGEDADSVAALARLFVAGRATAMAAVRAHWRAVVSVGLRKGVHHLT